jgi:glycosyltransferase involved in cell wall biosynthesis
MRILMINHEFTVSGASRMLLRLALALRANGHEITVFPMDARPGPVRDELAAGGIPIREQIDEPAFDLVIANTIFSAPALLEIGTRMKTIWWIHEVEIGLEAILKNPGWVRAFRLATAIVFQTEFQAHDLFRPFLLSRRPQDIAIIPNGIAPAPDDPDAAAGVPPAGEGVFRVITVGIVMPRKRQADLIDAVAQLPHLAVECVICGRHVELDPRAAATVRAAPSRYRLLGEVSPGAVGAWTKSSHAFCLPSASESQSLAVLEAAWLAKPPILSDLPVYRGTFTHGRNALMVPVGDVALLSMTLEGLATRPQLATRLGVAAREAVRHNTESRFLREFGDLLGRVA